MRGASEVARFVLELCALAALAYWGVVTGDGALEQVVWGLGAPLAAAVVWGLFVAPRAPSRLPLPQRLIPELAVFGAGAAALAGIGRPVLAIVFAFAVAADEVILYAVDDEGAWAGGRHDA